MRDGIFAERVALSKELLRTVPKIPGTSPINRGCFPRSSQDGPKTFQSVPPQGVVQKPVKLQAQRQASQIPETLALMSNSQSHQASDESRLNA